MHLGLLGTKELADVSVGSLEIIFCESRRIGCQKIINDSSEHVSVFKGRKHSLEATDG